MAPVARGRKRRVTPADDPTVLEEWRELERVFLDQGDSRFRSHVKIAKAYGVKSPSTVYAWLSYLGSSKHRRSRSYDDKKRHPNFAPRANFISRFRFDPARYIATMYASAEEAIDLEELSIRLQDTFNYLPRLKTLDNIVRHGNQRTGELILEHVAGSEPPRYQLRPGLYARYNSS